MGGRPEPVAGAPLNVPPVLASNFELGSDRGYSRTDATPTWEALQELVGGLEGGTAVAFASGMGAIAAVLDQVAVGGTVALPDSPYQGVAGLVDAGAEQGRWQVVRLATEDTAGWLEIAELADLVWLESPANPLLGVADLPALCAAPRKPGSVLAVDSTFATPLIQRPLELGADVVVHSATKYLGGHSDLLLGIAITRSQEIAHRLRERRALAGATPGALEAYLTIRGVRTLPLRLGRACASAGQLAEYLDAHPAVEVVRYPGLPAHPTHETARRFMSSFGAVVSFDVLGGADCADAVCRALRIIRHATSLGGVESTIERRAAIPGQTHLPAGLLRLSVGCEHIKDLIADLDQALEQSRSARG
jgi:cystathionine gamma-synthase